MRDIETDRVHISSWDAPFGGPYGKWAVHRMATRPLTFPTLAKAKAWVVGEYGPVVWSRDEMMDGRKVRVEWTPAPKP